ncbi:RND transporter [Pseudoalteromonas sp. A25]|uniref:efflux RND transporter periplasmic adaptor subunit n=1 Tax=Pseudoalteromonas sp. A25 TaxID=116092 RepID=UPI001260EED9|nr:HlyD family efflux transporter periplasmic adaptor subunit [Pseudoalteromonas sp. A25]BBN82338.1 RND transporter [Pseudoalteromonas sp. A25]
MDIPISKKTNSRVYTKVLIGGLSAVGVYGAITFASNNVSQGKTYNVPQGSLSVSAVSQGAFTEYLPLRGVVEPQDTIYIDAIDGGRVEQVYVQEGALVAQDQPILKLSNTNLQLNVLAREAEVSEQINNMRNTRLALEQNQLKLKRDVIELDYEVLKLEKEFARNKRLADQQLISQQAFEQTQDELQYQIKYRETVKQSQQKEALLQTQQLEQLSQSIKTLEANLAISRASLDKLVIKAPRAGQLTFLDAKVGESKSNGQRIGQVDLIERYKVSALVDEFYISRVHKEQKATFLLGQQTIELSVAKIYPGIEQGTFKIDFNINELSVMSQLRLGQSLQLKFNLSSSESKLQIANGGFMQYTAGNWVFVLSENGEQATKRMITTGRKNPQNIEVLSGLAPQEQVITSSYASFADAEHLTIIKNN